MAASFLDGIWGNSHETKLGIITGLGVRFLQVEGQGFKVQETCNQMRRWTLWLTSRIFNQLCDILQFLNCYSNSIRHYACAASRYDEAPQGKKPLGSTRRYPFFEFAKIAPFLAQCLDVYMFLQSKGLGSRA